MAITVHTTHRGGTDTSPIAGRCPFPVVVDAGSGTTSTHTYTAAGGGIGIRFDETKWDTILYTKATNRLSKTNLANLFSWEKVSLGTLPLLTDATWTVSTVDIGALYHVGTGVHGKPIAVRLNGTVIPEGTLGSLGDEEWAWGDIETIPIGASRIYVQSALTTPTVECIYGDGTHIRLESASGSVAVGWFEVKDKIDKDTIDLQTTFYSGGSATLTDVVAYQHVNPFTDLHYKWTCTASKVELITNGDQRPGAATTAIDPTKGFGPIKAFVFKEGFSTATISLLVNDYTNGDAEASASIVVNETSWSGVSRRYLSSAGSDAAADAQDAVWLTWEKGINWLRTATAPAELVLMAGETIDHAGASVTQWNGITGDRRVRSSSAESAASITVGSTERLIEMVNACDNLRMMDLNITKVGGITGGGALLVFGGQGACLLRIQATGNGSCAIVGFGTGGSSCPTYDAIIWDCDLSTTGGGTTSGVYPIFSGGSSVALDISRRAIIGCNLSCTGGEHVCRCYSKNSIWEYNQCYRQVSSAKTGLLIYTGSGVNAEYNYIARNYVALGSGTTDVTQAFSFGWESGGGEHQHELFEENYLEDQRTSASTTARKGLAIEVGQNLVIRNNILDGFPQSVTHDGNGGAARQVRFYHNSVFCDKQAAHTGIKTGTAATVTISNLKVVNNIFYLASSSTSGNYICENNGTGATLESTHFFRNNVYQIQGSAVLRVEGASSEIDADDGGTLWTARSMKNGQTNVGGRGLSPLDASDPLWVNPGANNYQLQVSSPCVGTGYVLKFIRRDFRGYVPASSGDRDDMGAFQLDGVDPEDTGGASPGSMGSVAARFRCVGLRRK